MSTYHIYQNLLAQVERVFRHSRQGSIQTRRRYKEAVCRFCYFLAEVYRLERLANIAPKHIFAYAEFLKEGGKAASTIKTDLAAIRFFHDQMPQVKYHTLPDNSMLDLERRSFGKVDRTWSEREFNRMIGKAWGEGREDYAAALCLARYCGLRIHEVFRLDTAAAERALKAGALTVKGKGGKVRTVPLTETPRIELTKMLAQTQRGHKLFVPDDMPTDRAINNFQCFIYRYRNEVQDADSHRPMTCHGLRHTFAVEQYLACRKQGMDEHAACRHVSRLLGHEREDVTRIYLASLRKGGEGNG